MANNSLELKFREPIKRPGEAPRGEEGAHDRFSLGRDVTPIDVSPEPKQSIVERREQDATGARTRIPFVSPLGITGDGHAAS